MATSLASKALSSRRLSNAWDNVAAAQTDAVLVAALPGRSIRVVGVFVNGRDAGGASTFTFNSKGAGAGTAISPQFSVPQHGGFILADAGSGGGWFETNSGEALTITTAASSAVSVIVAYEVEA